MNLHTVLYLLLTASQITSFTIIRRADRSTHLDDAIDILQRHIGEGQMGANNLLGGRELIVRDISDWLKPSNIHEERLGLDLDPVWNSNIYFKNTEPLLSHRVRPNNRQILPLVLSPTSEEIETIFDNNDPSLSRPDTREIPARSIEETFDTFKDVEKKSNSLEGGDTISQADNDLCLNSLTKEELNVLLKAVDTIKKHSSKFTNGTLKTSEVRDGLKETFESIKDAELVNNGLLTNNAKVETPFVKESEIILDKTTELDEEDDNEVKDNQVIYKVSPKESQSTIDNQKYLVNEISSDLEDDVAAEIEAKVNDAMKNDNKDANIDKYTLANDNFWKMKNNQRYNIFRKRNTKQSGLLLATFIKELLDDDHVNHKAIQENVPVRVLDQDFVQHDTERLNSHILQLEDEVNRLRALTQLEGLENDVLTDTLNEASLGQKEGSVSDFEFNSLQQALQIEEALKDLKKSRESKHTGVQWRQKRDLHIQGERNHFGKATPPFYTSLRLSSPDRRITKDDVQRLLGQTYLMKEQEPTYS